MLRVHPRLVKSCRHSAAKTVKTFEETPVYGKSLRSDSIRKGYQTENLGPQASVSEEMRLFYVAVTRAEQAVILFGNQGRDHTASWRHEVLAAETPLRAAGADFVP